MAGLDFKAPVPKEQEDAAVVAHNTRMGVILFVVYVLFYGGFMALIAFYGYDGFLYSIGHLAGWIVALFIIAEPLKRLGLQHRRLGQSAGARHAPLLEAHDQKGYHGRHHRGHALVPGLDSPERASL